MWISECERRVWLVGAKTRSQRGRGSDVEIDQGSDGLESLSSSTCVLGPFCPWSYTRHGALTELGPLQPWLERKRSRARPLRKSRPSCAGAGPQKLSVLAPAPEAVTWNGRFDESSSVDGTKLGDGESSASPPSSPVRIKTVARPGQSCLHPPDLQTQFVQKVAAN